MQLLTEFLAAFGSSVSLLFEHPSERIKHPGLTPTHIWSSHSVETTTLIVKEATLVAQVTNRPMRDFFGKIERIAIQFAQLRQRDYSSGSSVRINRIKLVMVVFWPSIRKKEAGAPKLVTSLERRVEIRWRR